MLDGEGLAPPWDAATLQVSAVLETDDELETGPGLIHGADLHVHETQGQGEFADDAFGDIGLYFGGFLGPGDPQSTVSLDASHEPGQGGREFAALRGETMDDV